MKVESYVLLFVGIFFGIVGAVYWLWSHEDAGSVMLLGTFLLGSVPGFYYLWWSRRMRRDPRTILRPLSRTGPGLSAHFRAAASGRSSSVSARPLWPWRSCSEPGRSELGSSWQSRPSSGSSTRAGEAAWSSSGLAARRDRGRGQDQPRALSRRTASTLANREAHHEHGKHDHQHDEGSEAEGKGDGRSQHPSGTS